MKHLKSFMLTWLALGIAGSTLASSLAAQEKEMDKKGGNMTILDNSIKIDASPETVWTVLANLELQEKYDPGEVRSQVISKERTGIGAIRQCDLKPRGWLRERVIEWKPNEALGFELTECTLPVKKLMYSYTLRPDGNGTLVTQRMEYMLKFGPIGKLMNILMVRKKWDKGIKGFFAGLKQYVENNERLQGKQ